MNEHILAAIIANDEAEAFLRIEEFDDALAFADDLGRHSATRTAAAEPAAAAAAAAAEPAAAAAAAEAASTAAIATATAAAAKGGTVAKATAAEATAIAGTAVKASKFFTTTETVALVTAATTAVTLTPSIETHGIPNSLVPLSS